MRKRKLRPTFLLQCVTLGFCLGLVMVVFFIAGLGVISGSVLIAMVCLWFLGIEAGLLPALFEHVLTRRAENDSRGAVNNSCCSPPQA